MSAITPKYNLAGKRLLLGLLLFVVFAAQTAVAAGLCLMQKESSASQMATISHSHCGDEVMQAPEISAAAELFSCCEQCEPCAVYSPTLFAAATDMPLAFTHKQISTLYEPFYTSAIQHPSFRPPIR